MSHVELSSRCETRPQFISQELLWYAGAAIPRSGNFIDRYARTMEYGEGDHERWQGEAEGSTQQTESSVRLVKRARRMGIHHGGIWYDQHE